MHRLNKYCYTVLNYETFSISRYMAFLLTVQMDRILKLECLFCILLGMLLKAN